MESRIVTCTRNTKETNITITINLDGQGKANIGFDLSSSFCASLYVF